jgi:hypothetical protein
MPIVDCVRERYILLIPTAVPGFIPTDEQKGRSARIEGVEDTVRASFVLNPQLTHMGVTRHLNA